MNQRRIILRYLRPVGRFNWVVETCLKPGFCSAIPGHAAVGVNVVSCMMDSRRLTCLSHFLERALTDDRRFFHPIHITYGSTPNLADALGSRARQGRPLPNQSLSQATKCLTSQLFEKDLVPHRLDRAGTRLVSSQDGSRKVRTGFMPQLGIGHQIWPSPL